MESDTVSSELPTTSQDCSSVDDSRDEQSSAEGPAVPLLSKLKSPRLSDLSRKRKVATNPPPKGKRPCRGYTAAEPRGVSASQRVKEFAGDPLCVSLGKLFCNACREELSLKSERR